MSDQINQAVMRLGLFAQQLRKTLCLYPIIMILCYFSQHCVIEGGKYWWKFCIVKSTHALSPIQGKGEVGGATLTTVSSIIRLLDYTLFGANVSRSSAIFSEASRRGNSKQGTQISFSKRTETTRGIASKRKEVTGRGIRKKSKLFNNGKTKT